MRERTLSTSNVRPRYASPPRLLQLFSSLGKAEWSGHGGMGKRGRRERLPPSLPNRKKEKKEKKKIPPRMRRAAKGGIDQFSRCGNCWRASRNEIRGSANNSNRFPGNREKYMTSARGGISSNPRISRALAGITRSWRAPTSTRAECFQRGGMLGYISGGPRRIRMNPAEGRKGEEGRGWRPHVRGFYR